MSKNRNWHPSHTWKQTEAFIKPAPYFLLTNYEMIFIYLKARQCLNLLREFNLLHTVLTFIPAALRASCAGASHLDGKLYQKGLRGSKNDGALSRTTLPNLQDLYSKCSRLKMKEDS